jgi:hypothetical protein
VTHRSPQTRFASPAARVVAESAKRLSGLPRVTAEHQADFNRLRIALPVNAPRALLPNTRRAHCTPPEAA